MSMSIKIHVIPEIPVSVTVHVYVRFNVRLTLKSVIKKLIYVVLMFVKNVIPS